MTLPQYFDLGMGQKGYEEEGSWDGGGEIWGDTLRMCQHNQFCMTYLFYNHHPCRLSTVSMEVERGECTGKRRPQWGRGEGQDNKRANKASTCKFHL